MSGTVKEIMSTMLETSFLIVSGREGGRSLPVIFKLQRYIANANSGKNSFPDLVVSDKTLSCNVSYNQLLSEEFDVVSAYQILDRSLPARLDRKSSSLAFSPVKINN